MVYFQFYKRIHKVLFKFQTNYTLPHEGGISKADLYPNKVSPAGHWKTAYHLILPVKKVIDLGSNLDVCLIKLELPAYENIVMPPRREHIFKNIFIKCKPMPVEEAAVAYHKVFVR